MSTLAQRPWRFWRHLVTDHRTARRAFPPAALARIEARDRRGRTQHIAARCASPSKAALPLALRAAAARRRASARSRCSAGCASGIPRRTAACSSTCCSPIATSRSSPIAAFIARSATAAWQAICRTMEVGVPRRPLRGRRGRRHRRDQRAARAAFSAHGGRRRTSCRTSRSCSRASGARASLSLGAARRRAGAGRSPPRCRCSRSPVATVDPVPPHDQQPSCPATNRPKSTMTVVGRQPEDAPSARRSDSITRMPMFSLKFCTAIEWPAPISTWPRCCSSAFIGTTKNPAQRADQRSSARTAIGSCVHEDHRR